MTHNPTRRVFTTLVCVWLAIGVAFAQAGAPPRKPVLAPRADALRLAPAPGGPRLSTRLAALSDPAVRSLGAKRQAVALSLPEAGPGSLVYEGDRVVVEIRLRPGADLRARVAALRRAGARIRLTSRRYMTVGAAVDPGRLRAVAAVSGVRGVTEALTPAFGAATCPSGSVLSEGDSQLRAADARTQFGVDGANVKVGALSDSFSRVASPPTTASEDVANADLPGAANPCGHTGTVDVTDDSFAGGHDEGRAMLQIVHDLAPGAPLAFARAAEFPTSIGMADNIRALKNAGAKVIVDDVTNFEEPFFQDGPVSVAVNEVTAAGVPYIAHASNFNQVVGGNDVGSWEAPAFRATGCPTALLDFLAGQGRDPGDYECMDFDPDAGAIDRRFRISMAPGEYANVDLQWAQPWNGVATDLDAFFLPADPDEPPFAGGNNLNVSVTQKPFEYASANNISSSDFEMDVVIARYTGPGGGNSASPRLKFVLVEGGGPSATPIDFNTGTGGDLVGHQIFGHNGAEAAITTAAVPFLDSSTVEDYSSRGPLTLYYGPVNGVSPANPLGTPQKIQKPDISATDCGVTSFFGQLIGADWRFCGTSAAAPHAAAVAALMLQARPPATPSQIRAAMKSTARPVGSFGASAAGAGLLDAVGAIGALPAGPTYQFADQWGSYGSGDGEFGSPVAVAADGDDVYVAEDTNSRVQKFTSAGGFVTKWGSSGTGDGEFFGPYGVATHASDVYVSDSGVHRIQKFTPTGGFVTKWGSFGSGDGEFGWPYGVATDAGGNVYVASQDPDRVQEFTSSGGFITKWGTSGTGNGQFEDPWGVAVNPSTGDVFVADAGNDRVQKFTASGGFVDEWGSSGSGDGEFNDPRGIAVDPVTGDVFVADTGNNRVQQFTSNGAFVGTWGGSGSGDGQLNGPRGIAVDPVAGDVFVADTGNYRIQRFTSGSARLDTRIISEKGSHKKRWKWFRFRGSGGVAPLRFECKLDSGDYERCTSPQTYTHLRKGRHTFWVRAIDARDQVDPTPAKWRWKT